MSAILFRKDLTEKLKPDAIQFVFFIQSVEMDRRYLSSNVV